MDPPATVPGRSRVEAPAVREDPVALVADGLGRVGLPLGEQFLWLQNQGIRAMPYLPGKNWILSQATKGVKEAADAVTLPSPAPR